MDLINFATDPTKEVEGARIEVDGETTLIIARYDNKAFRKLRSKLLEPYVTARGRKGATEEQAQEVLERCLGETVLLGWEGLMLDGEEVPYSKEKAIELMKDPRLVDFKEMVMYQSQLLENYRLEAFEEDLGNSETLSDTEQDGA